MGFHFFFRRDPLNQESLIEINHRMQPLKRILDAVLYGERSVGCRIDKSESHRDERLPETLKYLCFPKLIFSSGTRVCSEIIVNLSLRVPALCKTQRLGWVGSVVGWSRGVSLLFPPRSFLLPRSREILSERGDEKYRRKGERGD